MAVKWVSKDRIAYFLLRHREINLQGHPGEVLQVTTQYRLLISDVLIKTKILIMK